MPYRCPSCSRSIAEFEKATTLTRYLHPTDNKFVDEMKEVERCPVCKCEGRYGFLPTDRPPSPIPHCPHCKQLVNELNAERKATIRGTLKVGAIPNVYYDSDYALYGDSFGDEENPNDPNHWKLTCPHCEKVITDPNDCLKPYAV